MIGMGGNCRREFRWDFFGGATLPECRPPKKSRNFREWGRPRDLSPRATPIREKIISKLFHEWGRPRDLSPRSTPCLRLGVIEETISEALGMHFDNRSANSELVFGAR